MSFNMFYQLYVEFRNVQRVTGLSQIERALSQVRSHQKSFQQLESGAGFDVN